MKRYFISGVLILLFIQTLTVAGNLYVPSRDYATIQSAIDAAVNGDVVIVSPGTYTGTGNVDLDFNGKAITVKSQINPANPNPDIIAATIIDCQGGRYLPSEVLADPSKRSPHRAFWFHNGEDNNSKVLGFTIINGYAQGPKGADGQFGYNGLPLSKFDPVSADPTDDPNTLPPRALNGADATGNGYGGAILCEAASSPTIMHCVIRDCTVTGGQGGDGAVGQNGPWQHWTLGDEDPCFPGQIAPDATITDNDDGQWGGHGGGGGGNGYGGAIACSANSNPIISDCIISNNFARGGSAGDAGNGGDADPDGGDESGGGNAGASIGDGTGGGIYADGSSPIITNCTFSNNVATTGARGTGGQRGFGDEADPRVPEGLDGWVFSTGGIAGGAAWYGNNSNANFTNCTFTGNKAYEAYFFYNPIVGEDISGYTVGGALYSNSNNGVTLDTCEFISNRGGAVYCNSGCNLNFDDCLFTDNSETTNGGALYIGSGATVDIQNSIFSNNSAYDDGGALKCKSNAVLTNCSFGGNRADSDNDGYGYGGAMDLYQPGATLTINADKCSFTANQSIIGGGLSSENFVATFTDCYFLDNTALDGGGLDLVNGNLTFTAGAINGNNATDGDGGGLNCSYTITEIKDCTISNNSADGVYPAGGDGGAINLYGVVGNQEIFNCLIFGNSAAVNGGAIACGNATPDIGNCTFSDNSAGGYGGAVFSDFTSGPDIIDSIFQNNNNHAIHEDDFGGDAIVTYSLFYNNPDGDYYDSGTGMTYSGSGQVGSIPGGSNNRYGGPLFESGPLGEFYLNQTSSPAVDNGSGTAASLGLDSYTTDAANAPDSGQVDMGYHYIDIAGAEIFQLTASVTAGQGTIEPETGDYYDGALVTLTAEPQAGWWVKAWSGTDDDSSTAKTNSVVMNSDRTVTVEFKQPRTLIVAVGGGEPGYYSNIQDAVADAEDGDTIVVYPGIYYGGYLGVMIYVDKSITIRSINPEDPCYVAATIIDGYMTSQFNEGYDNLGVTFGPHTNANTILNGFTIQNCGGYFGTGLDGDRSAPFFHPDGYDGGMGSGAAIRVSSGGGPVIKNCVIRDNVVIGGNGGNAVGADDTHNAGRGGWGGYAWGGAVYCDVNSSPTFINCRIIDNEARGGVGGDGGNEADPDGFANYGGNWSMDGTPEYPVFDIDPYSLIITPVTDGGLWEVWGYVGDYRWYGGLGGGVFINEGSNVTFIDCEISGNLAQGGMSGQGGLQDPVPRPLEPLIPYEIPTFGGGVYCAADSNVTFTGCTIADNISSEPNDPPDNRIDPYLGHGGGVCAEDTAMLKFTNCTFSENEAAAGGGLHFADANAVISDCDFTSNSAFQGGGLFGEHGLATILRSNFISNTASSEPNDPNVVTLGFGGGLHLWATDANIIDCSINSNQAEASGGGAYFGGEGTLSLINCLLTNNTAGRDGGGVSANIFSQLTLSNCTVADNTVTGTGFDTGYGGGLCSAYNNYSFMDNCIIWGNSAANGRQIAVLSAESPSSVVVEYSDIQGGNSITQYPSTGGNIWVDQGCLFQPGAGNIGADIVNDDPLFVSGILGDYYLSQTATQDPNQSSNSPCVDAGSASASSLGMDNYTTRTDHVPDRGFVDMGYHYRRDMGVARCGVCDLVFDGTINFADFAAFGLRWFDQGCSEDNNWCGGADFNFDGVVDLWDAAYFGSCWFAVDDEPPVPNPMLWRITPGTASATSIFMGAAIAYDEWGGPVEYDFQCNDANENSGWQSDPNYNNTGLVSGRQYSYRVRARDEWDNQTAFSNYASIVVGEDSTPPEPDPMTWAVLPHAVSVDSISMTASQASDSSGVEYGFWNLDTGVIVWQNDREFLDEGLDLLTEYTYRAAARDKSINENTTAWSAPASATTADEPTPPDIDPPVTGVHANIYKAAFVPPAAGQFNPQEVLLGDGYHHQMTAVTATDDTPPVQYRFICVSDSRFSSGWQEDNPIYDVLVATQSRSSWIWQVVTRDSVSPTPNVGDLSDYWNCRGQTFPYP